VEIEPWLYAALTATGVLTGFIDAIAGGGGLIMMPALLSAGLPPHLALGTNKLQSAMGTGMSARTYRANGQYRITGNRLTVLIVFTASACGALVVQAIDPAVLAPIIAVLLVVLALYVLLSHRMDDSDRHERLSPRGYMPVGGAIGFYDGFFGPGTGSFLTTSLVGLRGLGLTRAAGLAKLFNFTSNAAALIMFALGGQVIWLLGLCIGIGSMTGSFLGSHSALRFGARLIRPLLVVSSLALTARLLWNYFGS